MWNWLKKYVQFVAGIFNLRIIYRNHYERLTDDNERLAHENERLAHNNERLAHENERLAHNNERLAHENERLAHDKEQLVENLRLMMISRNRYAQLVHDLRFTPYHRRVEVGAALGNTSVHEHEQVDAVIAGDAYRFPQRISFPNLPGIDAGTFKIHIVDVGAQPLLFEEDIYAPLLRAGTCRVIGFDPFADPNFDQSLKAETPPAEAQRYGTQITVLPYIIGDGNKANFNINAFSPTSSLFTSNLILMNEFSSLAETCATRSVVEVTTHRLDDVTEIDSCDFLKVDVQGGDFDVIAHGKRVLDKALFVHIEAEFAEIYVKQPLFAEVDLFLRQQDFQFVDFVKFGWNNYKALPSSILRSRLLWADCIYMKNPELLVGRDPLLLLRSAYIAHVNYRKYDLAAHLINLYDKHIGGSLHSAYVSAIRPGLDQ